MSCFGQFLHYNAHSSTRGFLTLTRAHSLIKIREWLKFTEIVNYGQRIPNHAKFFNFDLFSAQCARTTRARTRTDAKFWNAPNDLKRALNWLDFDFEHFKFLTRAHVRVMTRTGTSIVTLLAHCLKLLCTKFGQFMILCYVVMNDNVKKQNGA